MSGSTINNNVGSATGSQSFNPIAEAGQWKGGLRAKFDSARVDGTVDPKRLKAAAYQSMVAPYAGTVELKDLPRDQATALINARAAQLAAFLPEYLEMVNASDVTNEILKSWAESIEHNAKEDKAADKRRMAKAQINKSADEKRTLQERFVKATCNGARKNALRSVTGNAATTMSQNTTNRQPPANRPPGARAAATGTAAGMAGGGMASIAGGPGLGALAAPSGSQSTLGVNTGPKNRFG